MIHIKFINYFIVLIFIFAATFPIQPTFAMEENSEQPNIIVEGEGYLSRFATAVMDKMYGIDLDITISQFAKDPIDDVQSERSFFLNVSDDATTVIFTYAYMVERDINILKAIALTCRHGYKLVQKPEWWLLLRPIYFSHLPEEYIAILSHGHGEAGLKMCNILLHQLYGYQVDEKKRLCEMLQSEPTEQYPESESILRNKISKEDKEGWIKKLGTLLQYDLDSLESEEKEALRKQINSPYKRYIYMEKVLNSINSEIVERCFDFIEILGGEVRILWQCSLTRVTPMGAECIRKWLLDHDDQFSEVVVNLSRNHLRWIPEQLLPLPKVTSLTLSNNLLCYLPKSLENMKDHLTVLNIGNFEPYYPLFTNRYCRRTLGNSFRKIPSSIVKLTKLISLDMSSVELEEFSESEIYQAIPTLQQVDVIHNNLANIPEDQWPVGVTVDSYGNPGSPYIWFHERMGDYCYDLWQRLPSWNFT